MKTFLIVISALVVAACCFLALIWFGLWSLPITEPKSHWVRIADPTKATNLLIVAPREPSSFWFRVRGHVDGVADLFVAVPGEKNVRSDFSNHISGGYVDWGATSDYFSTGAVFHYTPVNVNTGVLVIEYSLR